LILKDSKMLKKTTLLLIDDDPIWIAFMTQALSNKDIFLLTTTQPENAIDLAINHKIDLLITDTNMRQFTGIEVLNKIRSHPAISTLPVIVFFQGLQGSPITREEVYKRGATAVFSKAEVLDFFWFIEEFTKRT